MKELITILINEGAIIVLSEYLWCLLIGSIGKGVSWKGTSFLIS